MSLPLTARHQVALAALLSHWRRRPFQLFTLVVGLAIATALWSGVQALNVQARQSYDEAARMIGGDTRASIVAAGGSTIAQADYIAMRRAGILVSPVIEGDIRIDGTRFRLIGIDPVTLPPDAAPVSLGNGDGGGDIDIVNFLVSPSLALADPATVERLGGGDARPRLDGGAQLPPLTSAQDIAPMTVVTDVGAAQRLLEMEGRLTRLVVAQEPGEAFEQGFSDRFRIVAPDESGDLERLTDSFHLNLTAFGFLSFLVGLFIVNSSIGLAFEQRRAMFRTIRACGVSARALACLMIVELVTLAALAGLLGTLAGYAIAATLLPDVAASLRGLYGAQVSGELSLRPTWWLAGIAISVLGALFAASASLIRAWRLPLFATAQPHAWAAAQRRTLKWQSAVALVLGLAALALAAFGSGLVAGFMLMGAILLSAALVLPAVLAVALKLMERRIRGPVTAWILADTRQQLGGLSLALMALLLALAVNIGVGTMVDSFRLTFIGWLDQRLAAELYVGVQDEEEARTISAWLADRKEVDAVLPVWNSETRYRDFPVEVFGFQPHGTYAQNWPLLQSTQTVWQDAAEGEALLVSEQLARRFQLDVGAIMELPTPQGTFSAEIGAIYSDYGNPRGQVMIAVDQLTARFPDAERDDFAVRAQPDAVPALIQDLRSEFGLSKNEVIDQAALKAFSRRVFERTFAVTLALNTLTLIVAGIALLASLLTLATIRLPQLAPVWALGLTRRRLAAIELSKALALALATALLAVPLGLLVAWVLTAIINVEAFGWRLPIHLFPLDWLRLIGLALLTALLASAWPAFSLRRTPPSTLLKVFADER